MGRTWLIALMLLSLPAVAALPENYPGAVLEEERAVPGVRHRVILGSLEKIANVLEPEAYDFVDGARTARTYHIPNERRVDEVSRHYRASLADIADILFSCEGRRCGSSNYWANTVFDMPILYGPEQYQTYLIGRERSSGHYVIVYVGQRGTRKIYVQVEQIQVSGDGVDRDKGAAAAISSAGQFTYYADEERLPALAATVAELMASQPDMRLVIVGHAPLNDDETVVAAQQRSQSLAADLQAALVEAGVATERVDAYGVGPLAPGAVQGRQRLELMTRTRLYGD